MNIRVAISSKSDLNGSSNDSSLKVIIYTFLFFTITIKLPVTLYERIVFWLCDGVSYSEYITLTAYNIPPSIPRSPRQTPRCYTSNILPDIFLRRHSIPSLSNVGVVIRFFNSDHAVGFDRDPSLHIVSSYVRKLVTDTVSHIFIRHVEAGFVVLVVANV